MPSAWETVGPVLLPQDGKVLADFVNPAPDPQTVMTTLLISATNKADFLFQLRNALNEVVKQQLIKVAVTSESTVMQVIGDILVEPSGHLTIVMMGTALGTVSASIIANY